MERVYWCRVVQLFSCSVAEISSGPVAFAVMDNNDLTSAIPTWRINRLLLTKSLTVGMISPFISVGVIFELKIN